MAVWEVRLVFRDGDRFWENVWDVDVGSADDVPPALILAFEAFGLNLLRDIYSLSKIVRRPAGSHDEFIEVIVEAAGHVLSSGVKVLPLFNTIKLLLNGGVGRVGYKFLRGYLANDGLADEQGHINPSIVTLVQGEADALFNAASDAACQIVYGAAHKVAVSPAVQSLVQERQRHRKRKKKVV